MFFFPFNVIDHDVIDNFVWRGCRNDESLQLLDLKRFSRLTYMWTNCFLIRHNFTMLYTTLWNLLLTLLYTTNSWEHMREHHDVSKAAQQFLIVDPNLLLKVGIRVEILSLTRAEEFRSYIILHPLRDGVRFRPHVMIYPKIHNALSWDLALLMILFGFPSWWYMLSLRMKNYAILYSRCSDDKQTTSSKSPTTDWR